MDATIGIIFILLGIIGIIAGIINWYYFFKAYAKWDIEEMIFHWIIMIIMAINLKN